MCVCVSSETDVQQEVWPLTDAASDRADEHKDVMNNSAVLPGDLINPAPL